MVEHVDEGAQRRKKLTTIQPMVSTTPPGKKYSNDIRTNETLLQIITNHVLLTLYVIVVDAPIVHQRPRPTTRSSTMLEMTHRLPTAEHGPIDEGLDQVECDDHLLMNFIKNKKQKNKSLYIFSRQILLI
jgi:hypothetical protein